MKAKRQQETLSTLFHELSNTLAAIHALAEFHKDETPSMAAPKAFAEIQQCAHKAHQTLQKLKNLKNLTPSSQKP